MRKPVLRGFQPGHAQTRLLSYKIEILLVLFNFINLTQVHNFTVSAQGIFTFRRLSVFTVSFTGIRKY